MPFSHHLFGALCAIALAIGLVAQAVPDAELPHAEFAVPFEPTADMVTIDLARDGTLMFDGTRVGYAELSARLATRAATPAQREQASADADATLSRVIVRLRAHAHVPTCAVGKILAACAHEDVGFWKVQLGIRGDTVLPISSPKAPTADDLPTVHVEYAQSPGTIEDVGVQLAKLAKDPAKRVPSPNQPGMTEPPPIRVQSDGDVAWSHTIAAIDRAMAAGIVDVRLQVLTTDDQDAAWAETKDVAVLVDATGARDTAPSFRFVRPAEFQAEMWNGAIGLGGLVGGAGGAYGGRGGGRARLAQRATPVAESIAASLAWLASKQAPDGSWGKNVAPVQVGDASLGEVGITSLALLAFLGDGNTMRGGPHRDNVKLATVWLRERQDPSSGQFGRGTNSLEHALATLAFTETYGLSSYKLLKKNARLAITHLESLDPNTNSVAGAWRTQAIEAARDFELTIDPKSNAEPEAAAASPPPSLVTDAANVFADYVRGNKVTVDSEPVQRIVAALPPSTASVSDLEPMAWFYVSHALFQVGADPWQQWSKRLATILPTSQNKTGDHAGSWTLEDAAGKPIDRTYATALLCLALQSHYRVTRMVR